MTALAEQTALVTGGSRGIGKAVVQALAGAGVKVAFVYRGAQDAAEALVAEITITGGTAVAIQADVADPEAGPRCVKQVVETWGRLDILVNNAGVIRDGLFLRMDRPDWDAVLNTNVGSLYNFCRPAVEQMQLKQRYGRIINVSSVAATYTNAGQVNYAASKGAVNSFTRALAVEVASRNVTVNAVAPGFIETDMSSAVLNKAGDLLKKAIPMRRTGKPEDIAKVVLFLAGPDSAYITGQVITVDGGLSLGAAGV